MMKNILHNFQWNLKSREREIMCIQNEKRLEFSSFPLAVSLNTNFYKIRQTLKNKFFSFYPCLYCIYLSSIRCHFIFHFKSNTIHS